MLLNAVSLSYLVTLKYIPDKIPCPVISEIVNLTVQSAKYRVDVCSTPPLCRGIQSAFRRVTHQRPRRRRRRRVYFGPYRNNPDNNGMDQIVTLPCRNLSGGLLTWLLV